MSAVAIQAQPLAPHMYGNMALSSPSHHPPADLQANGQAMQMLMQLMEQMMQMVMQQMMQQMMQMMQNQGFGASAEEDPFSGSSPAGACQGAPGGDMPQGAPDAAQGGGAPQAPAADAPGAPAAGTQGPASSSGPAHVGGAPAGMPAEQWQGCVEAGQKTGVDPYILAAQAKQESQFGSGLAGSPSAGDGVMQVEPGTRGAYASKFEAKMGHAYDHGNVKDQIAMAGVILADKGGSATNMLQKYNGGDNWAPGATDSYGRPILADQYAAKVSASAEEMRKSAGA